MKREEMSEAVDRDSIVAVVAMSQWVWSKADKTWVNDNAEDGGDFCDKCDVSDTQPKEATRTDENTRIRLFKRQII
jgi:hypothetical protein